MNYLVIDLEMCRVKKLELNPGMRLPSMHFRVGRASELYYWGFVCGIAVEVWVSRLLMGNIDFSNA